MSSTTFKTMDQERAKFALDRIQAVKNEELKFKNKKGQEEQANQKKFATYSKKLPALIINNGLLPTLAFLASKNESRAVYETLVEWLLETDFLSKSKLKKEPEDKKDEEGLNLYKAIDEVADMDASKLRAITTEALAFADWLKRLSEAYLSDEEGDGQES